MTFVWLEVEWLPSSLKREWSFQIQIQLCTAFTLWCGSAMDTPQKMPKVNLNGLDVMILVVTCIWYDVILGFLNPYAVSLGWSQLSSMSSPPKLKRHWFSLSVAPQGPHQDRTLNQVVVSSIHAGFNLTIFGIDSVLVLALTWRIKFDALHSIHVWM